jgi:hypothetical protein
MRTARALLRVATTATAVVVTAAVTVACPAPPGDACEGDADCETGSCQGGLCGETGPISAVEILAFDASPGTIAAGESSTLSWQTAAASGCEISPDLGAVPRSGSLLVEPASSTSYTLTCAGERGPVIAQASVTVTGAIDAGPDDAGPDDAGPDDAGTDDAGGLDGGPGDAGLSDAGDGGDGGADDAGAPVVSGDGDFVAPPSDLAGVGRTGIVFFAEQQDVLLDADLACDLHVARLYDEDGDTLGCVLPAGARVDSTFAHFLGGPDAGVATATIELPREVVAISHGTAALGASDFFKSETTTYLNAYDSTSFDVDRIELHDDRRSVTITMDTSSADQLRIFTLAAGAPRFRVGSPAVQGAPLPEDGSLVEGVLQNDGIVYVLDEVDGVTLADPLSVDGTEARRYDQATPPTGGTIAAGTTLDSVLLHFDAVDDTTFTSQQATITFTRPVLGFSSETATLNASDTAIGTPLTFLDDHRTELGGPSDFLVLFGDRRSLLMHLGAGGGGVDDVRVFLESP